MFRPSAGMFQGLPANAIVLFCWLVPFFSGPPAQERPALFIRPAADGYHAYVSTAIRKKHVPVEIVTNEEDAEFVLKISAAEITDQPAGSEIARCPSSSCDGTHDRGFMIAQLFKEDTLVWSYSVDKARGWNKRQAVAEEIVKRLKNDYFDAN